jgi:hypothetical protein
MLILQTEIPQITPQERTNAEMYYLSRIGKALSAVPETDELKVLLQHRRYAELCDREIPPNPHGVLN